MAHSSPRCQLAIAFFCLKQLCSKQMDKKMSNLILDLCYHTCFNTQTKLPLSLYSNAEFNLSDDFNIIQGICKH